MSYLSSSSTSSVGSKISSITSSTVSTFDSVTNRLGMRNMSLLQKFLMIVLAMAVVYMVIRRSEFFGEDETKVTFDKEGSQKQFDASESRQEELPTIPMLYDRNTGIVTAASEFVGLPDEIIPAWSDSDVVANYGKVDKLDDGYNGAMGLNYNMCSKSCCSPQYPPPFAVDKDVMVEKHKGEFVPNNYMCNNAWNDSGCVCMTQKQHDYIQGRGNNA